MLLRELFEAVGKNDYHPESFYAKTVAEFIKNEGAATWNDIYAYVELMLGDQFTGADLANVPSRNIPRWKIIVNNLHLHRTLEGGQFGNIVRIKNGFAMADFAAKNNIEILPDNNEKPRNPGKRDPVEIKRLVGKIVSAAYTTLGKPKMKNVDATRRNIENMVRKSPWESEDTLINNAMQIIKNDNS